MYSVQILTKIFIPFLKKKKKWESEKEKCSDAETESAVVNDMIWYMIWYLLHCKGHWFEFWEKKNKNVKKGEKKEKEMSLHICHFFFTISF